MSAPDRIQRIAFATPSVVPTQHKSFLREQKHVSSPRRRAPITAVANPLERTPPIKAELDALFAGMNIPATRPPSPQGNPLPPPSEIPDTATLALSEAELEADLISKKRAYKLAKAAFKDVREKDKKKRKEEKQRAREAATATPARLSDDAASPTAPVATAVTVCGGKTCKRLGADAVASMMGKGTVADGKCRKLCGGVGPTVSIGDSSVKIDFKAAMKAALESAELQVGAPPCPDDRSEDFRQTETGSM